ncbi:transporter substrate-binding domain-containing protein [Pseudomonas sp. S31]|nr:transporter substrate-binding domain-containing protein [Pseudomonas sp. S31]
MHLLSLLVLFCLALSASGAPALHTRAALDGPRYEPMADDLRWLWERRSLRLGVVERDNPPFDILGTGLAYEGITADYAGLLAEHLRLQVQVQVFATFAQAATALQEGTIDLLGSVSAQQALEAGLRLSLPYAEDTPLLMAPEQSQRPRNTDTQALRLAMVEGYRTLAQVQAHYPSAQVQLHPSPFSALTALWLGQADLYLGSDLGVHHVLGRGQLGRVEELGHAALSRQDIGFATAEHGSPLPRLVDAVLANLPERQRVRIRQRWTLATPSGRRPEPLQLSEAEQRWLREHPVVKVLVDEQALPLSYRDAKGQLRGLSLDVLSLVSRRSGLRFEVEGGTSVRRMVEQVRDGEAQLIAGLRHSQSHERHLRFSRAYLSTSRVLVTRDRAGTADSLARLEGLSVAVVQGSAMQQLLGQYPGIGQLTVRGPVEALHAVANGRVAAAVLTMAEARPSIARWYPGWLKVSASLPLPPAHFALASARGASELQSIIDKAMLSLAPQEAELLVRRWRNPMIVADSMWPRYRTQIAMGFAVAALLLLLALLWIRYLRRLQVRLRRATYAAESANQAKTHFLTTMSHEIRTPLHAVLGMLELAQRKAAQGVLDRLAVDVATDAARSLLELIGDILDISRIEAGRLQLTPQRVSLREQVCRAIQLFEQQARGKGLELHLEATGEVDVDVLLDPLRFKQVLGNLLSNAIKFTHQGHVRVRLQGQAKADRLQVALQVEDTGIGIAEAELAELGKPFRQGGNQRQSPRCSSGLGLGISRSLCEMMGGRMRLHSVLGQGTRVDVELDLALLPGADREDPCAATPTLPREVRLRVLVVDDYPANRLLLAQQLDYLGHQARVAEDGSQALRLWLKEHFDVVISDCNMPRMDGHALARAIREHERRSGRPACRLIGLTASALESERHRCHQAGMDVCLFKPLDMLALVKALGDQYPIHTAVETREFDLAHLQHIVGGDHIALNALLADLRSSIRDDLNQLDQVMDDPPALAELAHRVKGGARIARAQGLVEACEQLEQDCAVQPLPWPRLQQHVQALRETLQRLERQLEPGSYHAEQQQHQQYHQHHADDAGRAVAPAARVREDR